jgi:hypothetical protein
MAAWEVLAAQVDAVGLDIPVRNSLLQNACNAYSLNRKNFHTCDLIPGSVLDFTLLWVGLSSEKSLS